MLSNYPSSVGFGILKSTKTIRADSTKLATRFYANSTFFPIVGGTLTGTGGAGFIGLPSQVTAAGTPASGLNIYAQGSGFNWKGTDGFERQIGSTLTGGRTYTLPDVNGTFALGTGTTNRIPIWTASNTLGSSNALYNSSTKRWTWDSPSVLELPMGTDAQRPSPATTSDFWYNTTNGLEVYNGSDWFFVNPWKQSTSSSNVFLNSGSAIVNSSSVLNSLYKLQVNGGALYSGATFTTTATNQAALDIRSLNLTAQSGTSHALWGINIEGAMTFNTLNQTYGGLRIATTSNATASQIVRPFEISISSAVNGSAQIVNSNASNGIDWTVGGGGTGAPERVVMRSPNGGTSGSAVPGYNYLSTSGAFGWALTGQNKGLSIISNITGINPAANDPTLHLRDNKVIIGRRAATTPTATLEITGEGTGNGTTAFLVQNSGRANNAFRIRDDASARFGGKMMVGTDTSFVHNPAVDSTYIQGNTRVKAGNLTVEKASGTPYLNIIGSATSGNQEAGIYLKSRGSFSPVIEFDAASSSSSGRQLAFYNYNTARGGQQVFVIGSELGQFGAKSVGRFSIIDSLNTTRRFSFFSNGNAVFDSYGAGTKEASDLSKTLGNIAAFATDGTVLDYRITRDTSVSNADFTVTSTILSSCQELFISAEVTSSATDTVNIILPTPSATFKNNKVYVFGDDDSSTQWVATKSVNATGLYYSNGGVKPTATNYAAVTTTTGVSGVTYTWICTRRNSGTWNWVLIRQ
jgi:hypothetical protein